MKKITERTLSTTDSVFLVVGIIVGAGIFETPSIVASNLSSGRSIILIWLLGGIISFAGALCYADLAEAIPETGGDAVYYDRAFGKIPAFLFLWASFTVIQPGSITALAFVFSHHIHLLFGIPYHEGSTLVMLFALGIVSVMTYLNIIGIRVASCTQNLLSFSKILGLLILVAAAGWKILATGPVTTHPHFSDHWGLALILVLFTYGGWSGLAIVAGEVLMPGRSIRAALLIGLSICTVTYVGLNIVLLGVAGHSGLATSAEIMDTILPRHGGAFVSFLVVLCVSGAIHGLILTGGRIASTLGERCHYLQGLSAWNNSTKAPVRGLIAQFLMSILIILFCGTFGQTLIYTTTITWAFFALTGISIFVLRKRAPEIFKCRPKWFGHPLTTTILIATSVWLCWSSMVYSPMGTIWSLIIVASGFLFLKEKQIHT